MDSTLNEGVWHQYHKQESGTTKLQSSFLGLNVTSIRRMYVKQDANEYYPNPYRSHSYTDSIWYAMNSRRSGSNHFKECSH